MRLAMVGASIWGWCIVRASSLRRLTCYGRRVGRVPERIRLQFAQEEIEAAIPLWGLRVTCVVPGA